MRVTLTPTAREPDVAAWRRDVTACAEKIAYHARMPRKYEWASWLPWLPVWPEPPEPE